MNASGVSIPKGRQSGGSCIAFSNIDSSVNKVTNLILLIKSESLRPTHIQGEENEIPFFDGGEGACQRTC